MSILLGFVTIVAALLTLTVSATVFQLRASDPAGNGLAHAFLAIGVIALWGTLAIVLALVAVRQQRYALPWASINTYTLVLFVLAAAGQLACMAQLTGRNTDGWFRLVLQMAVVIPPVVVLLHVAWRAYGLPLPMRPATLGAGAVVGALSVVALAGLLRSKAAPREIDVSALSYPALLIRDHSKVVIVRDTSDLTSMNNNYVINKTSDPHVIDSDFRIFELRDLQIAKSSLGLLVRGQGVEPVTFRLVPYQPSGTLESVRALVLQVKWLNSDSDLDAVIRRDLATAETMEEMIAILTRD